MRRTSVLSAAAFALLALPSAARAQSLLPPGSFVVGNTTAVIAIDESGDPASDHASWGSGFVGWTNLAPLSVGPPQGQINGSYLSTHNAMFAYGVGSDHRVYLNQGGFGSVWDGWTPLPPLQVQFESAAAASSSKKNKVYAFATSAGQVNYVSAVYGASWGAWSVLPSSAGTVRNYMSGAPGAMTLPETDTQYVFVQAEDGPLAYTSMPGGTPSGKWNYLSNSAYNPVFDGYAPAVAADSKHMYVFAVDVVSKQIFATTSANHSQTTTWSAWANIGTPTQTILAPTAGVLANGITMLYYVDVNGQLWLGQGNGTSFFNWQVIRGSY